MRNISQLIQYLCQMLMVFYCRFFFDLMIKSMVEYLVSMNSLDSPRKHRFSEQYFDDIATLVTTFTSDIISGYNRDVKVKLLKFIQIQVDFCTLLFNFYFLFFSKSRKSIHFTWIIYSIMQGTCRFGNLVTKFDENSTPL